MKHIHSLITTSILALAAAPTYAETDFFGKVNLSVQSSDDGEGAVTELRSNTSRLGLKGTEQLEDGLTLVYHYEVEIDPTDKSASSEDSIKARNQYIGLKGAFGEVLLGRNDTMLKQTQGKLDLFNDYEGDIKVLWKGENRMGDTISYKSPEFNGVQFGISYILDEANDDASTSASVTYGDSALKKSDYYVALGLDSEVKGYDATRLVAGVKLAGVNVGVMYQTQENIVTGDEKSGYMVNAQYPVGGVTLKAQYQTLEDDSGVSIGADKKLSKNTKAFAFYTTYTPDAGEDSSYLAFGLEHKF